MADYGMFDARAIANYLLAKAEVDQKKIDPLQLQKFVYIAHGWHLGLRGEPLLCQQVEAWPYGPVIPDLYFAFKQFGQNPIEGHAVFYDREARWWRQYQAELPPDTKQIVDRVWDAYKDYSGSQLINLTHAPGTPWAKTVAGLPVEQRRALPIPNELIREHYRALALKNKAAKEARDGAAANQ